MATVDFQLKQGEDKKIYFELTKDGEAFDLADAVNVKAILSVGSTEGYKYALIDETGYGKLTVSEGSGIAKAKAEVTITDFANLVSGTADTLTIVGQEFTAQAGTAIAGEATFQALTSNELTAQSLANQINNFVDLQPLIFASVIDDIKVLITAVNPGAAGNSYTLVYTDNDTNVGAIVSGATFTGGGDLVQNMINIWVERSHSQDFIAGRMKVIVLVAISNPNFEDDNKEVSEFVIYVGRVLTGEGASEII